MMYVYALVDPAPSDDALVLVRAGRLVAAAAHVTARPEPDEAALRAHDAIVRRLWEAAEAVLPVRFGAVFSDEAALRAELAARQDSLAAALAAVRGCAQMTIRVAAGDTPPPPHPPQGGSGTRYLQDRARALRAPEIDPVRPALAGLVRAERAERRAGVVSVFHLIPRARADEYRRALGDFRALVTGPFPPYAFAPEELP